MLLPNTLLYIDMSARAERRAKMLMIATTLFFFSAAFRRRRHADLFRQQLPSTPLTGCRHYAAMAIA